MIPMRLEEIAEAVGGKISNHRDLLVRSVALDSRKTEDGSIFVAIKGEHFDGAEFIPSLEGINCAVLSSKNVITSLPAIYVDDTVAALGKLAKYYKEEKLKLDHTIAITGSVGKTTTKEMTSLCFETICTTSKTQGNLNNHLGLPQTILNTDPHSRALVCEMGMNHKGEIDHLTRIACPDIAMITNIGTSHIEYLGSREGIAQAKLEITAGLKAGGKLILNGDEPLLKKRKYECETVYVGLEFSNDVFAKDIVNHQDGVCFIASVFGNEIKVFLPAFGIHNVMNALFAMTSATLAGAKPEKLSEALSRYSPVGMRQKMLKTPKGSKAIADCYNANPESMSASLNVLFSFDTEGRKIAVLGDMLELGQRSDECHIELGKKASRADLLFCYGEQAENIMAGALRAGMPKEKIYIFDSKEEMKKKISLTDSGNDVFMFKASRGIKLEEAIPEDWQ